VNKYFNLIFVLLLLSFKSYGTTQSKFIKFAGKKYTLSDDWYYYSPKKLFNNNHKILENAKVVGLVAFHSKDTELKSFKLTIREDFKEYCEKRLKKNLIKQKGTTLYKKIGSKNICITNFKVGKQSTQQYITPSSLSGLENIYELEILSFTIPSHAKDASTAVDKLMSEMLK